MNGSASKSGPAGASRRSGGQPVAERRHPRAGRRPGSSHRAAPRASTGSRKSARRRGRAARRVDRAPSARTSRGKSSGPPGVGSAHTSSSRKSGVSSWIRQGREVCAVSGAESHACRSCEIHTCMYVRAAGRSGGAAARTRGRAARVGRARALPLRLRQPRLEQVAREAGLHPRRALPPVQGQGGPGPGGDRVGRRDVAGARWAGRPTSSRSGRRADRAGARSRRLLPARHRPCRDGAEARVQRPGPSGGARARAGLGNRASSAAPV